MDRPSRKPLDESSPGAAIVREEQQLLERVRALLAERFRASRATAARSDYDAELIALRDEAAEAKPEDLPPLVEQMTRIAALAASHKRDLELPVDPQSPYFAHLRIRDGEAPASDEEEGPPSPLLRRSRRPGSPGARPRARGGPPRRRDILIGRRGLIDRRSGVQIVDWRDAPVSQIYYRYDEGDDYDEEVDERHLVGVVEARRNVTIAHAAIRRIGCPSGTFVADAAGTFFEAEGRAQPTLEGGQGTAARPPRPELVTRRGTRPGERALGVHGGAVPRADKHLPEIAALIDPTQFDLITASGPTSKSIAATGAVPPGMPPGGRGPTSGLVVIQGGAGSGKTTVALHRVAYLAFHDGQRYRPARCLVVVPSTALERYVAGVLPALGVPGVPVVTAAGWARSTRRKVVPRAPDRYTDETPSSVARVKKHPALLAAIDRFVADEARAIGEQLAHAASGDSGDKAPSARVRLAFSQIADEPLADRIAQLKRWLAGSGLSPVESQRVELALARARRRVRDVVAMWGELFTDGQRLRAALPTEGPDAVRDGEIAETVRWTAAQLEEPLEAELHDVDPEARSPVDGGVLDDSERGRASNRLDVEDDVLLLLLAQRLRGGLFRAPDPNRPQPKQPRPRAADEIRYDHVAIDEAQDLSALEIKLLVEAAGPPEDRSVTICGDEAQRLVFDNGFRGWARLLEDTGLAPVGKGATEVRPLHLSYRSTEEVMRFARGVLGPLAPLTDGEHAARPGAPVELHRFSAMGEAVGFLAEALRSLAGREPTASVALITRHPAQADAWHSALERAEVPSLRRVKRQDFAFAAGVDVTDVAQVKGLEFDYVVLLDVTPESYPATIESRHLLHIGATRAAHQLWLVAVGAPSQLVPAGLDGDATL